MMKPTVIDFIIMLIKFKPIKIVELGRRSIYHATHRDAYSGGTVRVCHVKKDGWNLISEQDCLELHRLYQAENKN